MNLKPYLPPLLGALAVFSNPVHATQATLTTTVLRTLVSDEDVYGGCAMVVQANVAGKLPNCTKWLTFDCSGTVSTKEIAYRKLTQAQLAMSLGSNVVITIVDTHKPGGLCHSKTVDGYTYDVTGGHILFSKDAAAMQWMKDKAGGDAAFVKNDRNTKIRFGREWVHYPFENGLGDLPKEANFDCLKGYVEAWHRRQVDGSSAPAEFGKWVRWRFGEGIA